jgi:glycosyltransferase involved in cell wall biosynthesis
MPFDVAVVVPTFNRAELLRQTLDAILSQTHRPAEVVVVDDGGGDHTEQVVTGYGPPVKYVKQANGGQSVARNTGVKASSAGWIALCDDDDLWKPTYLERMAAAVARFPDAEFAFSDFTVVRDGQWADEPKFVTAPAGYWDGAADTDGPFRLYRDMLARQFRFQPVFQSCCVVRRSLFDRVGGYDPAFSRMGAEDWEFTLRAVAAGPAVAVDEPLVGIRRHAGNFSGALLKILEGEVAILRHALAHHPAAAEHRAEIEAEIGKRTRAAAEVAFDQERFDRVRVLAKEVPAELRHGKLKLKAFIAGLPAFLAKPLKRVVSR